MGEHLHTGPEHIFAMFLGVWVIWNALRMAAAYLASKAGFIGSFGAALGGTL